MDAANCHPTQVRINDPEAETDETLLRYVEDREVCLTELAECIDPEAGDIDKRKGMAKQLYLAALNGAGVEKLGADLVREPVHFLGFQAARELTRDRTMAKHKPGINPHAEGYLTEHAILLQEAEQVAVRAAQKLAADHGLEVACAMHDGFRVFGDALDVETFAQLVDEDVQKVTG